MTKFIIMGKSDCQYCTKAKDLLTQKGLEFSYMNLGEDYTREELLEAVPEAKSVPQIFMMEETTTTYIGGFNELDKFFKNEVEVLLGEGHTVEVTFTKTDGTERTMLCTRNPNVIAEHYTAPEKKSDKTNTPNPDVIVVFDLDKTSWRSFRIDSIKSYAIVEEI